MRLDHHPALDARALLPFLAARAVPGVEEVVDGVYRRSLADGWVLDAPCRVRRRRGRAATAPRRQVLRLDADPEASGRAPGRRSAARPARSRAEPGRRIPGHPDPDELAVRALLGQQMSVAAARTFAGRLVAAAASRWAEPVGGVTHRFPSPEALAALDPEALPMPRGPRSRAGRHGGPGRSGSTCPAWGRGRWPTWRCGRGTTTRLCPRILA